MFIDEVTLKVKAGDGGAGAVAFFPMKKGPCGGPGGNGGNVYIQGNRQMADLHNYVGSAVWKAESGQKGQGFRKNGKHGEDLILRVPLGTLLTDTETGYQIEVNDDVRVHLLAKGGTGGKGNMSFATPTHQVPRISEPGTTGQKKKFTVVLRLIADVGLIGLPNAGKSSLLNELTAAKVKTAMYAFTTLEPNLGVFRNMVIADIPGLIEGASEGKGLGFKFLKHVEKVPVLLHCIAADSSDPMRDFETINTELGNFNPEILQKKQIVVLTKTDLISHEKLSELRTLFEKTGHEVWQVSIYNPGEFEVLKENLLNLVAFQTVSSNE